MKKLFTGRWPSTVPVERRLTLAAFGKHPGWDDHLPGIGIQTEALADVKQSLYVTGIGGELDSGAWQKLEPEKRLEGFDHVFLWLRAGHVMPGCFWSSSDGKGRKEYPMVVCVDGEAIPPAAVLARCWPPLDQLRASCRSATNAEQVHAACRATQDRLTALANEPDEDPPRKIPSMDARRRFLDHPRLGAGRVGLLRVLHQLASAASGGPGLGNAAGVHSCHLRLPFIGASNSEAFLLWAAFLRAVVPLPVPVLFLRRGSEDWLDAVLGRAASDDLFCLQASPKALPLTTEIPYELPPAVNEQLKSLAAAFFEHDFNETLPGQKRPDTSVDGAGTAAPRSWRAWVLGLGLLCLGIAAAVWLLQPAAPPAGKKAPAVSTEALPPQQTRYEIAVRDGRLAFDQTNFPEAAARADAALAIKPGDPTATKLKNDALAQIAQASAAHDSARKFESALSLARAAFERSDFAGALTQASAALTLKSNDAAALKLKHDAQAQAAALAAAAELERKFQALLTAGRAAYDRADFTGAVAQAGAAARLRPGDPAALKLKQDAQFRMAQLAQAAEDQRTYQASMQAAQDALDHNQFALAALQAGQALTVKTNDSAALQLQARARQKAADLPAAHPNTANTVASAPSLTNASPQAGSVPGAAAPRQFTNQLGMEFVQVQARSGPGIWIGKYEVTQRQFQSVMGRLPESQGVQAADYPVANVLFQDAQDFCKRMGDRDGRRYALPSKADWLAVAGLPAQDWQKAWTDMVAKGVLNHEVTSWRLTSGRGAPSRVGSLGVQSNQVCDLFGNVREWVIAEDGGESAGFSYNSHLVYPERLFVKPTPGTEGIVPTTGFRCLLLQASP